MLGGTLLVILRLALPYWHTFRKTEHCAVRRISSRFRVETWICEDAENRQVILNLDAAEQTCGAGIATDFRVQADVSKHALTY